MKVRRIMKIGVETQRVVSLTKRIGAIETWCSQCDEQRQMIHPEEAAARAGVRLVEARQLHFIETPEGLVLICPNSVTQARDFH